MSVASCWTDPAPGWRRGEAARARGSGTRPPRRGGCARALVPLLLLWLLPAPSFGQGAELAQGCAGPAVLLPEGCLTAAQALLVTQPRLLLGVTGGNPVPGTASTLGMRIGTMPRWSVAGRLTGVRIGNLPILDGEGVRAATVGVAAADVALGVYPGLSLAPTVGGIGSLDLLGSVGLLLAPESAGLRDGPHVGWGAGVRVGILRESFTMPGISLSGSYRDLGEVRAEGSGPGAAHWRSELSGLSLRGALSKDLFGFGVAAGAGLDRVRADAAYGGERALAPQARVNGLTDTRTMAFGSASFTFIILHGVLELGWQEGGEEVPGAPPAQREPAGDAAWYGSLVLRVSI